MRGRAAPPHPEIYRVPPPPPPGDSLHCICRDLTMIAPCFERVLLQTADLFRGEQSGSMENCGKTVPIFPINKPK